jgi:uncharacterized membrane protein YccC
VPAAVVVVLAAWWGLVEPAWAITACVYVVSVSRAASLQRIRRRLLGTAVGVPLGLACVPLAIAHPQFAWCGAAISVMVYALSLRERYDIACASFAFALMITLAASGEH